MANSISFTHGGLSATGSENGLFTALSSWFRRQQSIRQTVNELSELSERELNDLGIARGDIYAIARQAADNPTR